MQTNKTAMNPDLLASSSGIHSVGRANLRYSGLARKAALLVASVLTIFLSEGLSAEAQNAYYVRAAASGAQNGSDWTNAFSSLPATLVRGATYYLADGSYGSRTLDTANSGSSYITFKKATASNHGTDTGWSSSYGDGQAVFGSITLTTDYWIIDGTTRNESNWSDGSSYGIKISEIYTNALSYGHASDNVTIKYADIGGTYSLSYSAGIPNAAFYFGGFSQTCDNWTISRVFAHNVGIVGQMAGVNNVVWEYSWLGLNWSKEIVRGQVRATNVTFRYNIFKDGCRDDNAPGTGCTAEVALFGNQGDTPNFEGLKIYGNVVWKSIDQHKTDATFLGEANDCKIFNNTIYDYSDSGVATLKCLLGGEIRNNIGYVPRGIAFGCQASTCSDNSTYTSNPPFVNVSTGNFHLTGALAGTSLGSPYNVDRDGNTRGADGTWDRGAFEFGGGNPPPPPPPDDPPAVPTGVHIME